MYERNKISYKAVVVSLIFFVAATIFFIALIKNRSDIEKVKKEQLLVSKSIQINNVISKLLYKTQVLEAFIQQGAMER